MGKESLTFCTTLRLTTGSILRVNMRVATGRKDHTRRTQGILMKENFPPGKEPIKERANIFGLAKNHTQVTSSRVSLMERGSWSIQRDGGMREGSRMESLMGMESLLGAQIIIMRVSFPTGR